MPAKPIFTNEEIADALRAAHGLLATTAQILTKVGGGRKITRQAVSGRIKRSPELREVAEQAAETLTDLAEQELYKLIKQGYKTAIIFYLKCKGKDRGYIERQELTGKDGTALTGDKLEPVEVNIKIIDPAGKVKPLED